LRRASASHGAVVPSVHHEGDVIRAAMGLYFDTPGLAHVVCHTWRHQLEASRFITRANQLEHFAECFDLSGNAAAAPQQRAGGQCIA